MDFWVEIESCGLGSWTWTLRRCVELTVARGGRSRWWDGSSPKGRYQGSFTCRSALDAYFPSHLRYSQTISTDIANHHFMLSLQSLQTRLQRILPWSLGAFHSLLAHYLLVTCIWLNFLLAQSPSPVYSSLASLLNAATRLFIYFREESLYQSSRI